MLNNFYKQFKSGTDIRGVAVEGVKGQDINLTDEVVASMAQGFALWLSAKVNKPCDQLKVTIGRDSRISGPRIAGIVADELKSVGARVLDCSLASTPSMFMTTVDLEADGAVMITASHHPFNRNGLKFFTRSGGLEGKDIEQILEYAQNGDKAPEASGVVENCNYMAQYKEHLKDIIKKGVNAENYDKPLSGFKIVIDAGNGVGGFYADVLNLSLIHI